MSNSPKIKEAIIKAFEEIDNMTDDELKHAMENTPRHWITNCLEESGVFDKYDEIMNNTND